jgi:hypothetical protein
VRNSIRLKLLTVGAALLLVGTASTQAQERGTIQALATVVSSLSVIGTNNLQFGTVTPGVNKTVDKATVGFAGEWEVTGTANAEVSVDFTLPDSLVTTDSLAFLRIAFSNADVSYDDGTGTGQTNPAGILDPHGPGVLNIGSGATLMFWIGGTVLPRISQTGGDYAADIVLTVAYTGS